ncbi:MAG: carbohydrate porin [Akkermansia sp.]|nr:carbohydrate porin [Akkermansia sp.]
MKATSLCYILAATTVAGTAAAQQAAPYIDTAYGWKPVLLEVVEVPVPLQQALPSHEQMARRHTGVPTSNLVLQQTRSRDEDTSKAPCRGWRFLPATPQKFMPYLDALFVPGNTCAEPCGIVCQDMISTGAQKLKHALSRYGFQYDLTMSYNYSAIHPRTRHRNDFSSFNHSLTGTWFLAKDCDNSQGVFLTFEADWGQGTNFSERRSSAQNSLGSLSNPQGSLRGGKGVFLPQLALGYSGFDGKWVAMAGTLDVSNYLDQNAYTPGWAGGLMNQSFAYNPALPLTWANLGFLTAWQPCERFYAMYATTSTNTDINQNPFNELSANYWMHVAEAGFIMDDVWGMGAGTYRLQYTMVDHDGKLGLGFGMNIQQQMGKNSPLGFFTRVGFMDQDAAAATGTKAAATAGLMLQAPFRKSGWGSRSNYDNISLGFLWQRAASSENPVAHKDEYGLELSAVVQVTPTFFLQPDVQYIFNPIHSTGRDGAFVLQMQGVFKF